MIRESQLCRAWPKKSLSEVAEFLDNRRKPVKASERHEGKYPYYGANGQQGTINNYIFDEPLVLLAEDGGHFGEPEKSIAYTISGRTWVNNHAHVLRPVNGTDLQYLFRHLQHYDLTKYINGTTREKLTKSQAESIIIAVPSLAEQRRIAAILDKADAIRRKHEQALALADDFLRSTFLHMFGDPVTNPQGLPKDTLGNVIKVSSGEGLTASRMDASGFYPVYGGNGITGRHSEYLFESPKIVLGRVGVYCGTVHVTEPRSWVTDNALYVKSIIRKDVDLVYLAWALRVANLNQYASQAAQPLISGGRIYPVEILIPDRQSQRAFADQIGRQNQLVLTLQNAGQQANDLFSALSQRAFQGVL